MSTYTAPLPGVGSVGQYQMSGRPFATSSFAVPANGDTPIEITFPNVTQWVWVLNMGDNAGIKLGFSARGASGSAGEVNNYVIVPPEGGKETYRVRVNSIFLSSFGAAVAAGNVSVMAGITGIRSALSEVSGPNYSGSAGIG